MAARHVNADPKLASAYPVRYERRRYGTEHYTFYTWAYVTIDGAEHSLGDPWPSVRVPKTELAQAIQNLLDRRK